VSTDGVVRVRSTPTRPAAGGSLLAYLASTGVALDDAVTAHVDNLAAETVATLLVAV
jgi:hypothetical protein